MINIDTRLLDKTSPDGLYLLCRITAYMNANRFCFPSNKTLAKATGFSESKVMRVKNELKDSGLLSSEFRFRDDKSQTSSIYRFETDLIGVFVTGGKMSELTPPPVIDDTPPITTSDTPPVSELNTREVLEDLSINQKESFIEPKKEKSITLKLKKTKYIYPPTVEGLVPLFHAKLEEKKRVHVNITDTWNNANMQAEKFHLHHESKGWKIEKLNSAIALWVNNAITYGQVTKPCPVQYKGNPNTPQPATKLTYREEKPVFTQHDIEASEQFSSAAADVFKSLGVRV